MSTEKSACDSCKDTECSAGQKNPGERQEDYLERQAIAQRMCRIKHKILVLSGKGGVGKSTVAAGLAVRLAGIGKKVGLMDIDVHGPSIPKILNLEASRIEATGDTLIPARLGESLRVMSLGFFLPRQDDAVIWRGPMKFGIIKQFLRDVEWGDLDYLIVDSPPGTGDEPLSVAQLIGEADGALIVTTPQDLALSDVRRSITFCRQLELAVLGVVENMSGLCCPQCGHWIEVFKTGGGERMAAQMGVPFLGRIPLDPHIMEACDAGNLEDLGSAASEGAKLLDELADRIVSLVETQSDIDKTASAGGSN